MRAPLIPPAAQQWTMPDGYVVHGRIWPGAARPRAAVLYFHGIQSHGGWYAWSASVLAAAGCAVVFPDRRGSGLNDPPRGDVASIAQWRGDVDVLADWALEEFSVARISLVGLSWGAKLAVDLALRRPERVERLLLLTPGIYPAVDIGLTGRLRVAASLMTGGRAEHLIPLSDPALFTDNPAGRAFIESDDLKLTHATARFLWHSSRLDSHLRKRPARALGAVATLAIASEDRIIRNAPTVNWVRGICAKSPRIETFPGAHTLEFSADAGPFGRFLESWIG